jgi:tetratricopeptide (TPR) repeat protein
MVHRGSRVWRGLLIAFLLLLIIGGSASGGIWLWANHHLHAAEQAFRDNRLADAQIQIQKCLSVWPNSGPAHFLAGRTARRVFDFKRAEKHFQECRRLQGPSLPVSIELSLMGVQQGKVDLSEKYFQDEVAKGNPDAPLILEAFIEGYMRLDRLADVDACFVRWQQLENNNMYFYLLRGSFRERIPNLEEAAADYSKVLELNPEYDEARLRLIRVLLGEHDGDAALTQTLRMAERKPGNNEVQVLLARCYLELARPEEARPLLAQVLNKDPANTNALRASAQLAIEDGSPEDAEKSLRQLLAGDPHDREGRFLLAQCLKELGRDAQARDELAKFHSIEADWKALHEIRTRKISLSPFDPELRYQGGILLLRLGESKEGVEWLERALDLDPKHDASRKALVEYYQRIGDSRSAAKYRAPIEPGPDVSKKESAGLVPYQ